MELKTIVQSTGRDVDALLREYESISSTLRAIGLSEYESRAYLALVASGSSSASFVAETGQIPRTSAYRILRALERKGFARSKEGRPMTFTPADPSALGDRYANEIREAFSKIESLKDVLSTRGIPQLVYTILGKDRVFEKIGEMLDRAEHTFVISSPSIAEFRRRLGKKFTKAISRGVQVTVITSPFVKVPEHVKVIRRHGLIATDVIADASNALLAAPDLSACGYTDNEALSEHLQDFLRIMSESDGG
ncbi:MAG: TrmB family transcriptional regulator [Methanobacteriota archaeon]|nr:MAG: TrmB family transcriptional regulator [Euryarchaeota archaeon]